MYGTIRRRDQAPTEADPVDLTDPAGCRALEGLGFVELGWEWIQLPEADGPQAFVGADRSEDAAMHERGTTARILVDPAGTTAVSPEYAFGMAMAQFTTLLDSGDLVETRLAPTRRPPLGVEPSEEDEEGIDPEEMDAILAWLGLDDSALFPSLPGRGLHRRTVPGLHQRVYEAHQRHVVEVTEALGAAPVPWGSVDRYLAGCRRRWAVNEAHERDSARWLALEAWALAGSAAVVVCALALALGMAPAWVAACLAIPLAAAAAIGRVRHPVLWWGLLLAPGWLGLVASLLGTGRGTRLAVIGLGYAVFASGFLRDLAALAVHYRVYPGISARIRRPVRVPPDRLEQIYGE